MISRIPAVSNRHPTTGLAVHLAGHLHNPVTVVDQRDAGCPAAGHVQSQGLADAAGGSGDHCHLSLNGVHIDGATEGRLKGASSLGVEARLLNRCRHNLHD